MDNNENTQTTAITAANAQLTTEPVANTTDNNQLIKSDIFHTYYLSNDDHPCEEIITTLTFEGETYYPFIKEKPTNLKSPKYDWKNMAWIENEATAIGRQFTAVNKKIDNVTESVAKITTVQQTQAKTVADNDAKFDNLVKMVTMTNMNTGKITEAVAKLTATINQINKPTQPEIKDTKPDDSSDSKQEAATQSADNVKEGDGR